MILVHIGGAKGVGKSTTLNFLSSQMYPFSLRAITISKFLFKLAETQYQRPWRLLTDAERIEVRAQLKPALLQLPYDVILLDSHYIDMVEGIPTPIMPQEIQEMIDIHIIIQADPQDVLTRRRNDLHTRQRDLDIDQIREEITHEEAEAQRIGVSYSKPVYVLTNVDVHQTAHEIFNITLFHLLNNEKDSTEDSGIHHWERGEGSISEPEA